jgi:hypothetical protein
MSPYVTYMVAFSLFCLCLAEDTLWSTKRQKSAREMLKNNRLLTASTIITSKIIKWLQKSQPIFSIASFNRECQIFTLCAAFPSPVSTLVIFSMILNSNSPYNSPISAL